MSVRDTILNQMRFEVLLLFTQKLNQLYIDGFWEHEVKLDKRILRGIHDRISFSSNIKSTL